jgi:hypothetical protein
LIHNNSWLPGVYYAPDKQDEGEEDQDTYAHGNDDEKDASEDVDENELYKIIERSTNKGNQIWNQDEKEEAEDVGEVIPEDQDVIGHLEEETIGRGTSRQWKMLQSPEVVDDDDGNYNFLETKKANEGIKPTEVEDQDNNSMAIRKRIIKRKILL